jgi:hypothetical protein
MKRDRVALAPLYTNNLSLTTPAAYATNDKGPEYRFNIFDGDDKFVEAISAASAVRCTLLANVFQCLKESGVVQMNQLAAVVKYYFIVKNVSPPLSRPIGAQYINWLVAACKVARTTTQNMAVDKDLRMMSRTTRRAAEMKAADINLRNSTANWKAQHSSGHSRSEGSPTACWTWRSGVGKSLTLLLLGADDMLRRG